MRTGGVSRGSGYGTTCGAISMIRASKLFARFPASLSAASVDSTEVKTTEMFSL